MYKKKFFQLFSILVTQQMKTRAFILVLLFAVFLAETASFPGEIKNTCGKMSCMKMRSTLLKECHSQKNNGQKSSGSCNEKTDCSVCPVCLTFTFLPQYECSVNYLFPRKKYPLINIDCTSSYIPPVWKPPNSYPLYSQIT